MQAAHITHRVGGEFGIMTGLTDWLRLRLPMWGLSLALPVISPSAQVFGQQWFSATAIPLLSSHTKGH